MKNLQLNVQPTFKEVTKASINVKNGILYKDLEIVRGYNDAVVFKSNDVVWNSNARLACFAKSNIPIIYVDDFFMMLPSFVQEFILSHEYSHIRCGHNTMVKTGFSYNTKRLFKLPEEELNADKLAIELVGKEVAIESLDYLINYTNLSFASKNELKKRLKAIK